jgi:hypothetical protein
MEFPALRFLTENATERHDAKKSSASLRLLRPSARKEPSNIRRSAMERVSNYSPLFEKTKVFQISQFPTIRRSVNPLNPGQNHPFM